MSDVREIWKPVKPEVSISDGGILDVSVMPTAERCTRITIDVADSALARMAEHDLPYLVREALRSAIDRNYRKILQQVDAVILDREFVEHEVGRALRAEAASWWRNRMEDIDLEKP